MEIIVVLVILGAIALFFIALYNRLVRCATRERGLGRHRCPAQRRHDLIPNLVETVKATRRRSTVFQKVTERPRRAVSAGANGTPNSAAG